MFGLVTCAAPGNTRIPAGTTRGDTPRTTGRSRKRRGVGATPSAPGHEVGLRDTEASPGGVERGAGQVIVSSPVWGLGFGGWR